jgi:hypothetical protein
MLKRVRRRRMLESLESAIADLLNVAERWTTTGATLYDLRTRRAELLAAGRQYAACLARVRRT